MALEITTEYTPCSEPGNFDDPAIPNFEVRMTNMTTMDFRDVWYVADLETSITNFDGWVNDGRAFKIDSIGFNKPLVFESNPFLNDIFEAGESWSFVIQDYTSGGPASFFYSIGVGFMSPAGPPSTGSIIAIPEPATMTLVALGGIGVLLRRRRR